MKEVVIYSKEGCCLCEEAIQVLEKAQRSLPFVLKKVNILENNEIYERFKEEIPVIYIDSRKVFKHRVDEFKLMRLLRRA
jgi:glutaredoxin